MLKKIDGGDERDGDKVKAKAPWFGCREWFYNGHGV
jgi:hypothetical protein